MEQIVTERRQLDSNTGGDENHYFPAATLPFMCDNCIMQKVQGRTMATAWGHGMAT